MTSVQGDCHIPEHSTVSFVFMQLVQDIVLRFFKIMQYSHSQVLCIAGLSKVSCFSIAQVFRQFFAVLSRYPVMVTKCKDGKCKSTSNMAMFSYILMNKYNFVNG